MANEDYRREIRSGEDREPFGSGGIAKVSIERDERKSRSIYGCEYRRRKLNGVAGP